MIHIFYFGLAVTMFLAMLNSFLRGARKRQADTVLKLILFGIVLTIFAAFGWKHGLSAIVVALACRALGLPVAARLAVRLLGGSSALYVGLPPRRLRRISKELGRRMTPADFMKDVLEGRDRYQDAVDALLDYCMRRPAIQAVMREFGANRDTLKNLYRTLLLHGAGQWAGGNWVAGSALAYPHTLRYMLSNLHGPATLLEQAFRLLMHFERGAPLS